jgi:hypothetical protein
MIKRLSLTAASWAILLVTALAMAGAVVHWVRADLTDAVFSSFTTPTGS